MSVETKSGQQSEVSRIYTHALHDNLQRFPNFQNYWNLKFPHLSGSQMTYIFKDMIGSGVSCTVHKVKHIETQKCFAMKVVSVHETNNDHSFENRETKEKDNQLAIQREVKILENLKNFPNIIQLEHVFWNSGSLCMVFELIDSHLGESRLPSPLIKNYMFQLLKTLDHCHKNSIIHFDVKPRNILVDEKSQTIKLIDFGQSVFYWPETRYETKIGTVAFNSPEILFKYSFIHYATDIWSAGCVLLHLLFPSQAEEYFSSKLVSKQIQKLNEKFGTNTIKSFCDSRHIVYRRLENCAPQTWEKFLKLEKVKSTSREVMDLLNRLLEFDPLQRITAAEALKHPFFNSFQ